MEQNSNLSQSGRGRSLLLVSAAAALATAVFPFALLIVPALWAYAMFRTRPGWLGVFGALLLGAELFLMPLPAALALTALAVCGALGLYILQKKRLRCLYAAAAVAAVSVACLYCAVCLPGILSGAGPFASVQALTDAALTEYRLLAADAIAQLPADAAALFESSLGAVSQSVPLLVVPVLCVFGAALGLANLLFFRLFVRKRALGLASMAAFRFWSLPRAWTPGLLLLLIGSLALEWIGLDYAEGVTAAVNVVVGAPLIVQGLSVVDYFIVRKGKAVTGRRTLVYILLGVFLPLAQSLLMMFGCVEQLFRFRERDGGASLNTPQNP